MRRWDDSRFVRVGSDYLNNVLLLKISVKKPGLTGALFINSNSMYAALSFLSSFVSVTTGDVKDENMMRSNEDD
jgi:hypothetical protein